MEIGPDFMASGPGWSLICSETTADLNLGLELPVSVQCQLLEVARWSYYDQSKIRESDLSLERPSTDHPWRLAGLPSSGYMEMPSPNHLFNRPIR